MNAGGPGIAARLRYLVLGPLEARDAFGVLPVRRDRHLELLAVLVAARPEPVSAADLVDTLWGAAAPASAATTLRAYVSLLRSILGPDAVTTASGRYRLEAPVGHVDADDFRRLARAALDAASDGRDHELLGHADAALALWRGPVFGPIGSRHHDARVARFVRELTELRDDVREQQLRARSALGDVAALLPDLRTFALDVPQRESAHRLLVAALHRAGRSVEAMRAAAEGRAALAGAGFDPSPAFLELERSVLAHDAPPAPGPRAVAHPPAEVRRDPSNAPLVGRESVLRRLRAWLDDDASALAVVQGPAGAGKTRVAAALDPRDGSLVVRTRCPDDEADRPGTCTAALARGLLAHGRDVPAWVRGALAVLLPELRSGDVSAWKADDVEDAVVAVAEHVGSEHPVVWVVDDAHWASARTLRLVRRLLERGAARVLVLARPEGATSLAALQTWAARRGPTTSIELSPLSEADVTALIARWAGGDGSAASLHRLGSVVCRRTAGHALFAALTVAELLADGAVRVDGDGWGGPAIDDPDDVARHTPPGAEAMIQAVVAALGPEARTGLDVLAVAARPIATPTWFAAWPQADAPGSTADRLRTIGVLDRSGLVHVDPAGRYGLVHDVVADVLRSSMPAAAAALLHRTVGRSLARYEPGADDAEVLARHAALGHDDESLVRWGIRAADDVASTEAVETHRHRLAVLGDAIARLDASATAWTRELLALRVRLARRTFDLETVERIGSELLDAARRDGDTEAELDALAALADAATEGGDHRAGTERAAATLAFAERTGSRRAAAIEVDQRFALALVSTTTFATQAASVRAARQRLAPDDLVARAIAASTLARLAQFDGRLGEAVMGYLDAAAGYRRARRPRGEALSLGNAARVWLLADPDADVGPFFDAAVALLDPIGQRSLIDDDIAVWRASSTVATDRFGTVDAALDLLLASHAQLRAEGKALWAVEVATGLVAGLQRHRPDAVEDLLVAAVEYGRSADFPPGSPIWADVVWLQGLLAARHHDLGAAVELHRSVTDGGPSMPAAAQARAAQTIAALVGGAATRRAGAAFERLRSSLRGVDLISLLDAHRRAGADA